MKKWVVLVACVIAPVALAAAADDLFFGPAGSQGLQGAPGARGVPGVNPAGLAIDCGVNGLTIARDADGQRFVCNTHPQRPLQILATTDGLVSTAARVEPNTNSNATLVITGTTGVVGLYAENTSGTALSANQRVDLGSAVLLPFSAHTASCNALGAGCQADADCPTFSRAISGGCSAGTPNMIARQGFINANTVITSPGGDATGYRCETTSGTGYTVRAYVHCLGEGTP